MSDESTAWAELVTAQLQTLSRENERLWGELAELRDSHIDLAHRIADVAHEGRATREVLTAMQEDTA